jgi:hypothetical protein
MYVFIVVRNTSYLLISPVKIRINVVYLYLIIKYARVTWFGSYIIILAQLAYVHRDSIPSPRSLG